MKISKILLGIILISSFIFGKESLKMDIIGESTNADSKPVSAISYGVGTNRYTLPPTSPQVSYINPEYVRSIADVVFAPGPGPKESVIEIPSTGEYYDGGLKLNKLDVNCKIYANPTDCFHHSHCGWCGASKSCITGSSIGPLEPCINASFIYSPPAPNWQPQMKLVSHEVDGVKMTIIPK